MAPPSFNANGIPVVHGSYVSGNTTSLNHSINDAHIADAITQKQQQDVDERMSYYESSNTFGKPSSMNLESGGGVGTIPRGACRDTFWAILFYAHLLGIGVATLKYSPLMTNDLVTEYAQGAYRRFLSEGSSHGWFSWEDGSDERGHRYLDNEEEDFVLEMSTMWTVLMFSGLASILISSLAMSLIMAIPTAMIKIALAFNLLVTTAVCVFAIVVGAIVVGVIAGIGLVLTVYYTYIVWRRIPFAASTLVTALTAVKCNVGLAFFAYNNLVVTFLWALWWATAFVATTYVMGDCNAEGYCENEINGFIVFLFLVSFFWTFQVIKNVVHVTVAGTVGTWWFVPGEARSCCSSAVRNSYWRSITTSFGSICFGSLLVAIIQATREIVYSMRTQENSLLLCLIDCILSIIERIAKYFNKWAYIYVGLYGYGFIEASTNVLSLFQARGWYAIIDDYLVDTVLLMVSICVGILTGIIGAAVGNLMEQDEQGGGIIAGAFLVGALIGFVLCSTLFGLVSSAVNTVIVCFAEAPAEFQSNHPQLSQQMILAWRDAYPNEFGY